MYSSTLTRTGNSESVAISKPLRERLGLHAPEPVELDSPRENVVVIYFKRESPQSRIEALDAAEASNEGLSSGKEWPEGLEARELVRMSREDRTHGDYAL